MEDDVFKNITNIANAIDKSLTGMAGSVDKGASDLASSVDKSISNGDFSRLGSDLKDAAAKMVNPTVREWKNVQQGQAQNAADNIEHFRRKYSEQMNRNVQEREAYQSINSGRAKPARSAYNQSFSPSVANGFDAVPGWLMSIAGAVGGIFFLTVGAVGLATHSVAGAVFGFGCAIANALLFKAGRDRIVLSGHAQKYLQIIGDRAYIEIRELVDKTGMTSKKVIKELKTLISSGKIKKGAIDKDQTTLMLTDDVYNAYRQSLQSAAIAEKVEEAPVKSEADPGLDDMPEDVRRIISEGGQYIRTLRDDNDRIPDEDEMSQKLYKLEDTIKNIVAAARSHPETAPDLRRVTDYYLPTTDKLVKAYIELNGETVTGENIRDSKQQIREALDMINDAFEKILDSMYENMNWDLKSDIKVMQRMFEQDGLAGDNVFAAVGEVNEIPKPELTLNPND
ncbi:MAG: 5-bromo-4-chloroindolyl phosphate hydrolysis family protein [Lachnospiraceae bacterium]|nr:5-bromo-4-chloroindolyl phosphate hydrolysis family protein [Lachnospiraceae bacterium]